MKKSLLLAALAVAAVPAFAETDGITYEAKNGLTCTNLWIDAVYHNPAGWSALPWMAENMMNKARTACLGKYEGKNVVLVGFSKTMTVGDASNDYAHVVILDFLTGEVIKTQQLTVDGQPIAGLLCANQVGFDQFGHAWIAGYVATLQSPDTGATPLKIYNVDLGTGECTLAAALVADDEAASEIEGGGTRIDYCDLVGDITLENAGCNVMAAIASGSNTWVMSWQAEQGGEDWYGGLDGANVMSYTETYPDGVADWGTAPCVRIVLDEDYSNNLYYVDGFTSCATLYNNSGAMVDSFKAATELAPAVGTNGIGEFTLAGKDFIAYSTNQYVSPGFCSVRICELGENMAFEGMEPYWEIPSDGLGNTSDGGLRIHPVEARKYADANGKEAAYILTFKAANGVGVYVVAEEGFDMDSAHEEENGGVSDIVTDNSNAPVEYFNLMGVRVNNPAAGQLVIKRQGTEVTKVLVK